MSKQKHPEQQQQWNDGKKREGACKYLHFQIINILWAARLYKEIKQKNGFSWDGFCHIFPPLLLSKILRGPSTTSERHMKIGSSGVRVKAQKRKHEHKGGRRNFSALGCIIWIPYSFLSLVTVIPSLKHYFKQVFSVSSFFACKENLWPFIQLQRSCMLSQ